MRISLTYGRRQAELDVAEENVISLRRASSPSPIDDVSAAVRHALDEPFQFPPLRRALTPADHVAVVVDESIPNLVKYLTPILEVLQEAGVGPESVTLVCAPKTGDQAWLDDIPEAFEDVHVEIHDPTDRNKLSYLAATKQGRRVYLNRTVVDADQSIVLTRRTYDIRHGYTGAETTLYPVLSNEEARAMLDGAMSMAAAENIGLPMRREAEEVAWLLGAPFFVQVIDHPEQGLLHIVAGVQESSAEGERFLDAAFRVEADDLADVVLAALPGDPATHTFAALARAAANAARIVKPSGRIVLFTEAAPEIDDAAAVLRDVEEPHDALRHFQSSPTPDSAVGFQWASAAAHAQIYLLSGWDMDVAEDVFATPLLRPDEVRRLLTEDRTVAVLDDAHHALAVSCADAHSRLRVGAVK